MICARTLKQLMTQLVVLPSFLDSTLLCSSRDLRLCKANCRALSQNPFPEEVFESSVLVDGSASWDVLEPSVGTVAPSVSLSDSLGPMLEPGVSLYTSCSNSWLENSENWSSDCCGVKLSLASWTDPVWFGSAGSSVFVSTSTLNVFWDSIGSVSGFVDWRESLRPASETWLPEKPPFARPSLTVGSSRSCREKTSRNLL